jgi:trimeric autotransporter adhesin
MNHIYRLCWNRSLSQWVPASELAHATQVGGGSRKRGVAGQRVMALSLLAMSLSMAGLAHAGTVPTGGQVVSGSGQIQQLGNTTTIRQNSQTLSLNWQSFNIAPDQTVDFLQPNSSAIAINRIFSTTPSEIYGHLNANGQVWLINPNGILFGPDAQVNVGGLVASTLNLDDDTLDTSNRLFSGSGKGSIVNRGTITAANGGYVALLGNQVTNQGTITAQLGTVALAGGSAVTLTFTGNQLLHVQVDQSTLNNLAENGQLIVADGGRVIMTAGAKDSLLASVVNNTGVVQAQTVQNQNGTITLLGGMQAGQVNVGGTLDASAPNGGSGGSIETSAATFNLASDAHITAAAPHGQAGTWLVDPTDLTIDATSATTISNTLNGGTSVVEQTTATGAAGIGVRSAGAGDINVDAAVTWTNASTTLTLLANNAINVNASVNGAGKVVMDAGGANLTIASGASITGGAGVTLATAANFVNNANSTAVSTGTSAAWLIYSTNPTLDTTGGLTPNFIQYNAPFQTAAAASGNGFLYSLAPTLTVTGLTGSVTKTYDGTTNAPLTASNLITSGLFNGDTIASATGTYASSNAGSNIAVTTPSTISGFDITHSAGIPAYGYTLSGSATANIGTINAAQLTASIVGDPTKVYDGTTTATLSSSNYDLAGFVTGQGATVNQPSSVAYAGADAGMQTVNAAFSITNFVANSGTNLSNYILPTSATGQGKISQAPLLLSGLLATDKVYDGTAADSLNTSNVSLFGVISSDIGDVSLNTSGATGAFASNQAGNDIMVSASGFTLTGSKAGDYQIMEPNDLSANITPKALTISGVTATDKTYDATTNDTLNVGSASLSGVVSGDNVSLSTGSAAGNFSQSDVGNNLAVTASGFSLIGTAMGDYTLTQPSGLTANITQAALTVSFLGNPPKIYDGTNAATLTSGDFTINGFVAGQSAVVSQSPATYASVNAGSNIGVTATLQPSDFTPASGTSLSNYTFNSTVTGTGVINPAPLFVSIVNNPTKVFDGTTDATLTNGNYTLSGLINGESITLNAPTAGTYASANAGIEGVSAALSSDNFTAGSGTLLSNYLLPTVAAGFGTITPAALNISIIANISGNPTKVYDGTTAIALAPSNFTLSGFVNGDSAVVNTDISGTFATKNVGSQPLSAILQESDFNFTGSDEKDYTFPVAAFGTGTITPALLTVSIINNPTKVYDGSTVAQLISSNFQINGFVSGEGGTITPTTSFNYATANAGSNINITGSLTANNYTANSGTLLSNYTLATSASGPGAINQAPLFITGVTASDKVYDTTTSDTLNIGAVGLAGLVTSDASNVTLNTSTSGTFSQVNVGNNLAVSASGFSISGTASSNYILQPITGLTASITPATLTISGVTAANKAYDGTTSDTLGSSSATLNGVLGTDNVTLSSSGASGQFITADAGNNLAVTTSGFTLSGTQASNYTLTQPGGLTANITPAPLTAVITGSPTKVYDGTESATLTASDYTLTGFVTGQGATIPQSATANYTTPNAGTGLGVVSTLVTSDFVANAGTNLANYILPSSASGNNGVITPLVLNLTGTRVYDANTDGMGSLFGTITGLNGDTFTLSGQGSSSSKNVGSYTGTGSTTGSQPFNLGSLALVANGSVGSGTDLTGNYTLIGGADTLVITPALLTVTGTMVNTKTYDGTTNATLSGTQQLQGVFSGDDVKIANDVGNFVSPNAGMNIPVSSAITLGGSDAGNYILTQPSGLTGTINQVVINLMGTRQYDANNDASASAFGTSGVISTGVNGETLTVSGAGTVTSTNVGSYTGANFNLGTLALSNGSGLAGNYTLVGGTDSFAITPYVINLTGTRVYDTTTIADESLFGSSGLLTGVNGETLTLTGAGALSSKDVGTYKGTGSTTGSQPFNLNTLQLNDDTGLASNYTLIGGADTLVITPAVLTVTGTMVNTKTYDGTTNATLSGTQQLQGVLGTDNVTIATDVGNFASPNAGMSIPVASAITLGGTDGSNYILTQPTGLTGTINKVAINLSGTRQYDANTDANFSAFGNNGVIDTGVNGETLTLTGAGTVTSVNVGSYTGANFNLGTLALSNGSGLVSNYTLVGSTFAITPYVLNLSGSRAYDGTSGANASLFGNGGVLTGVNGEMLTLSGSGAVSSANASATPYTGIGSTTGSQPFNLNTLQLGNGTGLASNYTLIGGADALTINPAVINLSGSRAYDGASGANAGLFGNNGVLTGVNGETLTLSGSGTVSSANASTTPYTGIGSTTGSQPFNLNTLQLGNGTGQASNYTLIGGADALTINQAVINLSGTRQYDANTDANFNAFGNNGVIDTGVNGETLTLTGAGTVTGANVGSYTGANFNAGTLALSNGTGSAGNYTLTGGSDALAVTPYVLSLTGTRVYDGTTGANASLFGNNGVLTGVNGETLTLSGNGVLSTKNVGQQLPFASNGLNGFTLTGNGSALGGNYTLAGGTDWVTITPLAIVVSANGQSKTYDGDTTAGVTLASHGVLPGDTVSFNDGAANFSSPNAGSNVSIAVTGITASGADAGDYIFNTTASTSATINPYVLGLTGTRIYNGTPDAEANLFGNDGVLTGINGDTLTLSGNGTLTTKNVGSQLPFATGGLSGLTLMGNGSALASNYTLSGGTDWVTITPLSIIVTATGTNRLYNGQDGDAVTLGATGVLPGDSLSFADASANFANPDVGNNKIVTVTGITANGVDAGDYLIMDPVTTTTADITSVGFTGSGVQGSLIAQLQAGLQPMTIATPYGSSDMDAVGVFTGNQQLRHRPVERNRIRSDFDSGLSLQYQNGGVRLPSDASP